MAPSEEQTLVVCLLFPFPPMGLSADEPFQLDFYKPQWPPASSQPPPTPSRGLQKCSANAKCAHTKGSESQLPHPTIHQATPGPGVPTSPYWQPDCITARQEMQRRQHGPVEIPTRLHASSESAGLASLGPPTLHQAPGARLQTAAQPHHTVQHNS